MIATVTTIIGIDCATQPKKLGLARGRWDGQRGVVEQATLGSDVGVLAEAIAAWIEGPTLIAIDAPLGWPVELGRALAQHRAGDGIAGDPNELFRRETDRVVKRMVGKTSLDVGADRIARTAHAALRLLSELRAHTGEVVPLAWDPAVEGTMAIEVYPAATLAARSFVHRGYKGDPERSPAARRGLVEALRDEVGFTLDVERLIACDDILDAAVCVLAGADFLRGECVAPTDAELTVAQGEGWIWFRRPSVAPRSRRRER